MNRTALVARITLPLAATFLAGLAVLTRAESERWKACLQGTSGAPAMSPPRVDAILPPAELEVTCPSPAEAWNSIWELKGKVESLWPSLRHHPTQPDTTGLAHLQGTAGLPDGQWVAEFSLVSDLWHRALALSPPSPPRLHRRPTARGPGWTIELSGDCDLWTRWRAEAASSPIRGEMSNLRWAHSSTAASSPPHPPTFDPLASGDPGWTLSLSYRPIWTADHERNWGGRIPRHPLPAP